MTATRPKASGEQPSETIIAAPKAIRCRRWAHARATAPVAAPARNGNAPEMQQVAVAVAASARQGAFAARPHSRRPTVATAAAREAADATAVATTPAREATG